jgi:hypothetical protein
VRADIDLSSARIEVIVMMIHSTSILKVRRNGMDSGIIRIRIGRTRGSIREFPLDLLVYSGRSDAP